MNTEDQRVLYTIGMVLIQLTSKVEKKILKIKWRASRMIVESHMRSPGYMLGDLYYKLMKNSNILKISLLYSDKSSSD